MSPFCSAESSGTIREAVLHLTAFNERSVYGNSYAVKHDITMNDLLYRCRHVVKTEVDVIRDQMHRNGVEMLFGDAAFTDPHTIETESGNEAKLGRVGPSRRWRRGVRRSAGGQRRAELAREKLDKWPNSCRISKA